jgi:Pectate lyase superfamily protein
MAVPFQDGFPQFLDNSGNPLNAGKLHTYAAGTTTPIATYTTKAGTTANANPIILDSAGRANIWLTAGTAYRLLLKDSSDVTIRDVDNVIVSDGEADAGIFNVRDYGATGDGVTDDTTEIQAAIDAAIAAGGGEVFLPLGVYLTSATLDIDGNGVTMRGVGGLTTHTSIVVGSSGVVGEGGHTGATRILATATTGAAVRIWNSGCKIADLCIDGNSTRKAASLSTQYGILVEAADTAGGSTARTQIERVRVTNQPSHGVVMVNNIVSSRLDFVDVDHCKGHGFYISGGVLSSRTNKTRPGQVQIDNCRASRTGGHSLCIGGNDTLATDLPYRVEVHNFETFYNCITPSICVDAANPANAFISGENLAFYACAFDGRSEYPSIADTHSCITVRGNNIEFQVIRFIDGNPYAARVVGHPGLSSLSRGIEFDQVYIQNDYQSAGFYNPAVYYSTDVRSIRVIGALPSSIITKLSSRTTGSTWEEVFDDVRRSTRDTMSQLVGAIRSSDEVTLNDDQAGYITFGAATKGTLVLSGNLLAAGNALVVFRCGDANAFVSVLSSSGPTVTGTTGTLAGTTGTDTRLTIAADTATNRLYIENRTGSQRTYSYTFMGGSDTTELSAFTTV